jgi:hypothetical protein
MGKGTVTSDFATIVYNAKLRLGIGSASVALEDNLAHRVIGVTQLFYTIFQHIEGLFQRTSRPRPRHLTRDDVWMLPRINYNVTTLR